MNRIESKLISVLIVVTLSLFMLKQNIPFSSLNGEEKQESTDTTLALNYHLMHPGGDSAPEIPMSPFIWTGSTIYITSSPTHGRTVAPSAICM